MSYVIAIDGPAASGKSSVSRLVARRLGSVYVNSGALYRAVTWAALEANLDLTNVGAISDWVRNLGIECGVQDGESTLRINGVDPEPHLREQRVNANVSQVSALPAVREKLVEKLRSYASQAAVVMEGRDIGSVVFPETPHKFYIDASEEVRSKRRQAQGEADSISERDQRDSKRVTAPLRIPDGARVIDSSHMTLDQVVEEILRQLAASGIVPAAA